MKNHNKNGIDTETVRMYTFLQEIKPKIEIGENQICQIHAKT